LFDQAEEFGTDFTSESAGSPVSPISPVLSASSESFGLRTTGDDWLTWDNIEHSPEPETCFKAEPFDGSMLASFPPRSLSMSPSINPIDLSMPQTTDFNFGQDSMNIPPPLFQNTQVNIAMIPSQQPMDIPFTSQVPTWKAPVEQESFEDTKRYPSRNLKRKNSTTSESEEEEEHREIKRTSPSPKTPAAKAGNGPKKTAHNMIEKRYRTNLNDKIAQLRDSVPALRVAAQRMEQGSCGAEGDAEDDMSGLIPAPKLNKATILSKATEYIAQLERRNRGLETENNALRGRMEGLEMMLMSRGGMAPPNGMASNGMWN